MKKAHPIRCRALAARRARQARTLAARRRVEALAALIAFRRAVRERYSKLSPAWLADLVRRLQAGVAVDLATLARFGLVRIPPGLREIRYEAAPLKMRRA